MKLLVPHCSFARAVCSAGACLLAWLMVAAPLPEARASGVIGVNFNGLYREYNATEMANTRTGWYRGFIDYFAFKNGQRNLATDPDILALKAIHQAGYKSIINIKFDYSSMTFPTGSGIQTALSYLPTLLDAVYPYCDIVVGGNEPFIESETDNRGPALLNFYEGVANAIKSYEAGQTVKAPIYVGAFNNLWMPAWQTATTANLLAFVKANSWLAGIDLHIHHVQTSDATGAFNYASPKILSTQRILVTEFSLVHEWDNNMDGTIPSQLATQYGVDPSMTNCEFLSATCATPVSLAEWTCWLQNSPWFQGNVNCIATDFNVFNGYPQFYIAAYAIYQDQPNFACGVLPWELNPVYVNQTVVPGPNGLSQGNYGMFGNFVALPH